MDQYKIWQLEKDLWELSDANGYVAQATLQHLVDYLCGFEYLYPPTFHLEVIPLSMQIPQ
jgi:hypothetical protein